MVTREERIIRIRESLNNVRDTEIEFETYRVKGWRESTLRCSIIKLHCKYLMYRIENSRTIREQQKYLKENDGLLKDFFKDPESNKVQAAQEEILLQLINQSENNEAFRKSLINGQEEPAIISYDGYIINGNRRTAALKDEGVSYIYCVVLPEDAQKIDFYTIEHSYQISVSFKEDYHWVNELINYSQGVSNSGYSITKEQMANTFNIKTSELEIKLRMMILVDEFLEWKGIPVEYDYTKLDQTEQVFKELEKAIKKIKDEKNRNKLKNAIFMIIENPPEQGRLYKHVTDIIKYWSDVEKKVAEIVVENNLEEETLDSKNDNEKDKDIFDEFEKINNKDIDDNIYQNPEDSKVVSEIIIDAVEDVIAEKKDKSKAESLYTGVSSALRDIQGLSVEKYSTQLDATKNKLLVLIEVSEKLIKQIDNLNKED